MNNYFKNMTEIYEHLQDEESKTLFEARISYLIDRDSDAFLETVSKLYRDSKWRSVELEEKIRTVKPKGIIIFGCGHDGRMTKNWLLSWGYSVDFFCDNYKNGRIIDDIKVLPVDQIVKQYRDFLVIIGSSKYGKEMYVELVKSGFPYENILLPDRITKTVWAERGKQYFDLFSPVESEVYIDAGTFDGETVLDFCRWSGGGTKRYTHLSLLRICMKQYSIK